MTFLVRLEALAVGEKSVKLIFSKTPHPILDRTKKLRALTENAEIGCLDTEWKGLDVAYRFTCPAGHVVLKTPVQLTRYTNFCNECRCLRRTTVFRERVEALGFVWLDEHWKGDEAMHRFQCPFGHIWERKGRPGKLRFGCPHCYGDKVESNKCRTYERLHQLAKAQSGKCLTLSAGTLSSRYRFRCAKGHIFESSGENILRGAWCRQCSNKARCVYQLLKNGMSRLREVSAQHGGFCLSEHFNGVKEKYRFRCKAGHEWEANGTTVLTGSWCRRCYGDSLRLSIEIAHQHAHDNGGQCLSTVYVGNKEKLHWLCRRGHSWHSAMSNIRKGCWCPECAVQDRIGKRGNKKLSRYTATKNG